VSAVSTFSGRVPGAGDRRGLLESMRAIRALLRIHPDLVFLAAYDPAAAPLGQALAASRAS